MNTQEELQIIKLFAYTGLCIRDGFVIRYTNTGTKRSLSVLTLFEGTPDVVYQASTN